MANEQVPGKEELFGQGPPASAPTPPHDSRQEDFHRPGRQLIRNAQLALAPRPHAVPIGVRPRKQGFAPSLRKSRRLRPFQHVIHIENTGEQSRGQTGYGAAQPSGIATSVPAAPVSTKGKGRGTAAALVVACFCRRKAWPSLPRRSTLGFRAHPIEAKVSRAREGNRRPTGVSWAVEPVPRRSHVSAVDMDLFTCGVVAATAPPPSGRAPGRHLQLGGLSGSHRLRGNIPFHGYAKVTCAARRQTWPGSCSAAFRVHFQASHVDARIPA